MIHGYKLVLSCGACPEAYDVYDSEGKNVAYFRLRHGTFRVHHPEDYSTVIYSSQPNGDGCFYPEERLEELTKGVEALQEYLVNKDFKGMTGEEDE